MADEDQKILDDIYAGRVGPNQSLQAMQGYYGTDPIYDYYMNAGQTQQPTETESPGILNGFMRGAISGGAGVIGGQAELGNLYGIGDGTTAQWAKEVAQNNAKKKQYGLSDMIPFASDYWTNPEGAAYDAGNALGSSVVLGAETAAVTAAAGATAGALGIGVGAVRAANIARAAQKLAPMSRLETASYLGNNAVNIVANGIATKARAAGLNTVAKAMEGNLGKLYALNILKTPFEVSSEMGNAGQEALARGVDIDEARKEAWVTGAIQAPLLALSNTLEAGNLSQLFAKDAAKVGGKKALLSELGRLTAESLQNAWEEGMQQSSHEYAAGTQDLLGVVNPMQWSQEAKEEAAAGLTGGLALGGGHAIINRTLGGNKEENNAPNPEQARTYLQNLVANPNNPLHLSPEQLDSVDGVLETGDNEQILEAAQSYGWQPNATQEESKPTEETKPFDDSDMTRTESAKTYLDNLLQSPNFGEQGFANNPNNPNEHYSNPDVDAVRTTINDTLQSNDERSIQALATRLGWKYGGTEEIVKPLTPAEYLQQAIDNKQIPEYEAKILQNALNNQANKQQKIADAQAKYNDAVKTKNAEIAQYKKDNPKVLKKDHPNDYKELNAKRDKDIADIENKHQGNLDKLQKSVKQAQNNAKEVNNIVSNRAAKYGYAGQEQSQVASPTTREQRITMAQQQQYQANSHNLRQARLNSAFGENQETIPRVAATNPALRESIVNGKQINRQQRQQQENVAQNADRLNVENQRQQQQIDFEQREEQSAKESARLQGENETEQQNEQERAKLSNRVSNMGQRVKRTANVRSHARGMAQTLQQQHQQQVETQTQQAQEETKQGVVTQAEHDENARRRRKEAETQAKKEREERTKAAPTEKQSAKKSTKQESKKAPKQETKQETKETPKQEQEQETLSLNKAEMKEEERNNILAEKGNCVKNAKAKQKEAHKAIVEFLQPIIDALKNGVGKGVTDHYVDAETGLEVDASDLRGKEETKPGSSIRHERFSNNDPWYQQFYRENHRRPTQADYLEVAEEMARGVGGWEAGDEVRDAAGTFDNEFGAEVAQANAETLDYLHTMEDIYGELAEEFAQEKNKNEINAESNDNKVQSVQVQHKQSKASKETKANDNEGQGQNSEAELQVKGEEQEQRQKQETNPADSEAFDNHPMVKLLRKLGYTVYTDQEHWDESQAGHRQVEILKAGEKDTVYGAAENGAIYLNPKGWAATSHDTPIHEYIHLWFKMLEKSNPELLKKGIELLKKTRTWQAVLKDPNYKNLTDETRIASEVLARIGGERGVYRMQEMQRTMQKMGESQGIISRIISWIGQLFRHTQKEIAPTEDLANMNVWQFVDKPLNDIRNGLSNKEMQEKSKSNENTENGNDNAEFKITSGSIYSGGGLVDYALKSVIDGQFAIEKDPQIAGVYEDNNGKHMLNMDIKDFDPSKFKGKVDYLHASPPCPNFSGANNNMGEKPIDKELAKQVVRVLETVHPKVFTLENVPGYHDSEAMKIIIDAMDRLGYEHDNPAESTYNAADFGAATSRERIMLRAIDSKVGHLPKAPKGNPANAKAWDDALKETGIDINKLPEKPFKADGGLLRGVQDKVGDLRKLDKPFIVMDKMGKGVRMAFAGKPAPTIIAKGGEQRIFIPTLDKDGKPTGKYKVREATPQVMAVLQGLKGYKFPGGRTKTLSYRVVGNGIPAQLTQNVFGPLLKQIDEEGGQEAEFSIKAPTEQLSDVRKQYEGTDKWMKAPNGEDTNLDEKQWLTVRTPAFKDWFGDWENDSENASKIVDENGEPRVVYHGTNSTDFNTFSKEFIGMSSGDSGFFGRGFYFALGEGEAKAYGSKRIIPAFLNLRKPFNFKENFFTYKGKRASTIMGASNVAHILNIAEKYPTLAKKHKIETFDSKNNIARELTFAEFAHEIKDVIANKDFRISEVEETDGDKTYILSADINKVTIDIGDGKTDSWDEYGFQKKFAYKGDAEDKIVQAYYYLKDTKYDILNIPSAATIVMETDFNKMLADMGYDGAVQSLEGDEFVAFEPNQIKSATDNNGEFSKENDDIEFSIKSPAFKKWFGNSILKDEDGNPQVFYRGLGEHYDVNKQDDVTWISDNEEQADSYSQHRYEDSNREVLQVYARVENPADFGDSWDQMNFDDFKQKRLVPLLTRAFRNNNITKEDSLKLRDEIKNMSIGHLKDGKDEYHPMFEYYNEIDDIVPLLKKMGYDALKVTEGGHQTYGVIGKSHVKSATNNNGNYDINNDHIEYSIKNYHTKPGTDADLSAATQVVSRPDISTVKGYVEEGKQRVKDAKTQHSLDPVTAGLRFREKWIDKYDAISIFDKALLAAENQRLLAQGKPAIKQLAESEMYHTKVQMVANDVAGMQFCLLSGDKDAMDIVEKHYSLPAKNKIRVGKESTHVSLQMITDYLTDNEKSLKAFMEASGAENPVQALDTVVSAYGIIEDYENNKKAHDAWERSGRKGEEPAPYKFPKGMTLAKYQKVLAKAPQALHHAADMYFHFNNDLIHILRHAGVITENELKSYEKLYKHFCPLMRDFSDSEALDRYIRDVFGGGGIANVTNPLKHRSGEGSTRDILSPLGSTAIAIRAYVTRAERNMLAQEMVKTAEANHLDNLIHLYKDQNASPNPDESTIGVLFNGKKRIYYVDPALYGPLTNNFAPTVRLDIAWAKAVASVLRAGATTSPSFIVRNFFRDTFTAGISSHYGFIPIYDSIRGALALMNDPKFRTRFYARGIVNSNQFRDRRSAEKALIKQVNGKSKEYGLIDLAKAVWDYAWGRYSGFNELIEACTRAGLMKRAEEAGASPAQAAYEAIYGTINFNRSGTAGQQVNKIVPFFNACIQGGDLLYQEFKKDPQGTMFKISKYIIAPSLILWLANSDEPWYKELDPRIKQNYWCLPGGVRIQKTEWAIIFGSGIETLCDIASKKDPKAWKSFTTAARDTFLPNFIPTVMLPLIEWQANYSFFRDKPIVNSSMAKLPDEMQYSNYTSAGAVALGKATKLSPMKLENAWRSLTGTMGAFALQTTDLFDRDKASLPAKKTTEKPIMRDFFLNDTNLNRSTSDFFDLYTASQQQHRAYGKIGHPTREVSEISKAHSMITKAYRMKKDIDANKHLTSVQKRAKEDKIDKDIKRIASGMVKKYGKKYDIT